MLVKLVLLGDHNQRTVYRLKKLPTVVGRGRDADLTLAHPLVSRHHCELYEVESTLCVRDLGSLNGTFVGDFRVTEAALAHGDILTIGGAVFEVVVEVGQDALLPPAPAAAPAEDNFLDEIEPADDPLSEIDFSGIGETDSSPPAAPKKPAAQKPAPQKPAPEKSKPAKPAPPQPAAASDSDLPLVIDEVVPAAKEAAPAKPTPARGKGAEPKAPAPKAPGKQPAEPKGPGKTPAAPATAAAGESRIDFDNLMAEEEPSSSGSNTGGGDSGLNSFLRKLD
ncbi:MAG: FHA domain-containing protein [Planctomycetia bacterium]|nr:FHA domain-containing protein [Planctomycetia bacterium]